MELAALIIGGIAFVMVVQPFTQVIWGQPKIEFDFDISGVNGDKILLCRIYNRLITHRILQLLHVRRMVAEDVMAFYFIEEFESQRRICEMRPSIESLTGQRARCISLPPSTIPARFGIVIADKDKVVSVDKDENDIRHEFMPGLYRVCVILLVEGKAKKSCCNFGVTDSGIYMY